MTIDDKIVDTRGWLIPCRVRKLADSETSEREWYVLARLTAVPYGGYSLNLPDRLFADGRGVFLEEIMGQPASGYVNTVGNMTKL